MNLSFINGFYIYIYFIKLDYSFLRTGTAARPQDCAFENSRCVCKSV